MGSPSNIPRHGLMAVAVCRIVHEDVMRIIKYSLEEMLSQDAADRALDFWLTTVEPFFGLPARQKEIAVKVRSPAHCLPQPVFSQPCPCSKAGYTATWMSSERPG